jgi:hypothetical protein
LSLKNLWTLNFAADAGGWEVKQWEAKADFETRGVSAFCATGEEVVEELDCFKDDRLARVNAKEGEVFLLTDDLVEAGTVPNDFTAADVIDCRWLWIEECLLS